LIASVEALPDPETVRRLTKRRDRAKSEAYTKTPWVLDEQDRTVQSLRNPRYSVPPVSTARSKTMFDSDEDPFGKDLLSPSTATGNSFFMEDEKRKVSVAMHNDSQKVSDKLPGPAESCGVFDGLFADRDTG